MASEKEYIDCFGDICPVPIIKIEQKLKEIASGDEFMLVTDHSCTIESIKQIFTKRKVKFKMKEVMNGVWEVYIKKL